MTADFSLWLRREFNGSGPFTALIVIVEIDETTLWPLGSSYANVIGDDWSWPDMLELLDKSGLNWTGAAFFPARSEAGGPLSAAEARRRRAALEKRVIANRLTLNEGIFLDRQGRRLKVEELQT